MRLSMDDIRARFAVMYPHIYKNNPGVLDLLESAHFQISISEDMPDKNEALYHLALAQSKLALFGAIKGFLS